MSTDPPPPTPPLPEATQAPVAATSTPSGPDDTQRTPTVATPVPSDAVEGESAWAWWAVEAPTICLDPATGEAHAAGASLWLDAAAQRFAHHASRLTSRSVTLFRMADAAAFDNQLDGFALRLALGPDRGFAVVALDVAAAQGLVAPLIADATGLHPPASPGPTDALDATALGLLEFLALAGLDAVLKDLQPGTPPSIEAFGGVEMLRAHPREKRRAEIGYRVNIGPALGELRVALIDADAEDTAALGRVPALPSNSSFDVCLALPSVTLSAAERQAMALGDVVLLGAADLPALAQHAELVTATGWSLGPARLDDLQPDHLSVTIDDIAPRPMEPDLALRPLLGRLECTPQALRDRTAGETLRLPLDADAPIVLVAQGRVVAHGEPVTFEGQVGVRLLWVADSPAAEASA